MPPRSWRAASTTRSGGIVTAGDPAQEREFEIVVITGLSGSGKTLATAHSKTWIFLRRQPPRLADSRVRRPVRQAIGPEARGPGRGRARGDLPRRIPCDLRHPAPGPGHRARLLFFEADDEALIRRFSETRRRTPWPRAVRSSRESGASV